MRTTAVSGFCPPPPLCHYLSRARLRRPKRNENNICDFCPPPRYAIISLMPDSEGPSVMRTTAVVSAPPPPPLCHYLSRARLRRPNRNENSYQWFLPLPPLCHYLSRARLRRPKRNENNICDLCPSPPPPAMPLSLSCQTPKAQA